MRVRILPFTSLGSVVVSGSIAAMLAPSIACTDGASVDPTPVACVPSVYRIESVELPRSGSGAAQIAIDLDGDGAPDNRLGRLHATLAAFFDDWRPDKRLTDRLTAHDLAWFVTVQRCDGALAIDLAEGRDPDGDGRYQLTPGDDAAIGDDVRAADGIAELPLLGFTDALGLATGPGWVTARGVAVTLQAQDTGANHDQLDAIVGVGVELDDRALAPVAAFLTLHLGDSVVARALDGDDDATISVAELRASPTVAALIAPDVDVDSADGVLDRVSLGFTLHARRNLAETSTR